MLLDTLFSYLEAGRPGTALRPNHPSIPAPEKRFNNAEWRELFPAESLKGLRPRTVDKLLNELLSAEATTPADFTWRGQPELQPKELVDLLWRYALGHLTAPLPPYLTNWSF